MIHAYERRQAIHPHWVGFLRTSTIDDLVEHEGVPSTGRYVHENGVLTVFWDKYQPDVFFEKDGLLVHESIIRNPPNISDISLLKIGSKVFTAKAISVQIPGSSCSANLRLFSSDIPTFEQVFVRREYDSSSLPEKADTIVDLGANIGLSAMFFCLKYPKARILAVEPDAENFEVLVQNTASFRERIVTERCAAWIEDGVINLRTETDAGIPLEAWGRQVSISNSNSACQVRCSKVSTLLDEAGFQFVDILKIDIEGAELELFSSGAEIWLPRVRQIIVETHDRFRPGSESAVRAALSNGFVERLPSGENLIFDRS